MDDRIPEKIPYSIYEKFPLFRPVLKLGKGPKRQSWASPFQKMGVPHRTPLAMVSISVCYNVMQCQNIIWERPKIFISTGMGLLQEELDRILQTQKGTANHMAPYGGSRDLDRPGAGFQPLDFDDLKGREPLPTGRRGKRLGKRAGSLQVA